jgi:hypothetical protein
MFGVEWVMPRRVVDLLAFWKGRVNRYDNNILWNAIPSLLMWCILREMNAWSFDDCEKTSSDLHFYFLKSFFECISANSLLNISSFVEFVALFSLS